jgi:hypothetical protein
LPLAYILLSPYVFPIAALARIQFSETGNEGEMDLSARLSAAEIEALSDPELPLSHVLGLIKGSRKGLAGDAGLAFEEGLRLKNTLDEYEEKGKQTESV